MEVDWVGTGPAKNRNENFRDCSPNCHRRKQEVPKIGEKQGRESEGKKQSAVSEGNGTPRQPCFQTSGFGVDLGEVPEFSGTRWLGELIS